MIAKLFIWFLKRKTLSEKDRSLLMEGLMHSLGSVPIHAIITVDGNRNILVQGKALSTEQLVVLRESAAVTLKSYARNLIHDQIRFAAIDQGYLKSDDRYTQMFYKAALWVAQEEDALLRGIAADDPTV